jgi:hypothetical protein
MKPLTILPKNIQPVVKKLESCIQTWYSLLEMKPDSVAEQ